jgi:hypothetical protein
MSRASEREAAAKAAAILRRAGSDAAKKGEAQYDGEYGAGKLTKDQKKSQERHIPMTERDNSRGARVKRALWG